MEKENKNKEISDSVTVYEVSYLLLPSLALEQVPQEAASLQEAIISRGGAVISSENPILIDLAYPMIKVVQTNRIKCLSGYFGWIKFEMTNDGVGEIKKFFDGNDKIIRHLIIKTVRENTLLNGHMVFRSGEEEKKEEIAEEPGELMPESSPEEIDKSIDNLVIV